MLSTIHSAFRKILVKGCIEICRNSDVKSNFNKNFITNMALEPRYRIMLDQFFLYQHKVLLKPYLEKNL